jgi:hypothetical protein
MYTTHMEGPNIVQKFFNGFRLSSARTQGTLSKGPTGFSIAGLN